MAKNISILKVGNNKFINILFLILLKFLFSNGECNIDHPFKRDESCSSEICEENEENCSIDNSIIKMQWLNNIYIFNEYHFRYGSFALNNNGDLIIEYSYKNKRIFFGLKKNGKYYFDDNSTKIIEFENENYVRKHSKLIFVTNNNNQEQYLFSIGYENSITELYDIEDFSYKAYNTANITSREIYSYVSSLSEIIFEDNHKEYLFSYLYYWGDEGNNHYRNLILNKFSFSNFEVMPLNTSEDILIWINVHNRIANNFIMNNNIISFYLTGTFFFRIQAFDFYLNNITDLINIDTFIGDWPWGAVVFLKGLHLKDNLLLFNYYSYKTNLKIKLGQLTDSTFEEKLVANINYEETSINLSTDVLLNDCIKLNENRVIFLSLSSTQSSELYILLYNFYDNYKNLKIRVYKVFFYKYKIHSEFTINIYNEHLVFSSTVVNFDEISPTDENLFSIFLIFGYVKKEDILIEDISKYMNTEDNDNILNLVEFLTENIVIENNIFGYEVINDKIKLTSIPQEIIFYNKNDINTEISNDDFLNKDHIFKQNKIKLKNNEYYSLDYQIIVTESDYNNFNKYPIKILNFSSISSTNEEEKNFFQPKYYYGKVNTIKFKLCHEYCTSCYEYGDSNNNQKCISCTEEYNYDFFNENASNCIPKGYFNDKEEQKLVECNYFNSKFYINSTDNKKICFKFNYSCPLIYPSYDKITHECQSSNNSLYFSNNSYIYNHILENIINFCSSIEESIVIEGEDNFAFQITTNENELSTLNGNFDNNYNLSIIDLGECENLLKNKYEINKNDNLIIVKLEKLVNITAQRSVQYEIYNPNNVSEKLDISICKNTSIDLYFPVSLSEKTLILFDDLKEYGYDLFDINDKFYQDICTPYTSENNTDVLLVDRKNDFYNDNETGCQSNCEYSDYLPDSRLLKCKCNIINEKIDIKNPNKFDGLIILKSFYEILKYSNYKVLKCYKLVFTRNIFRKNKGCILVIVYFLLYLVFLLIYSIKGLEPIKINISKFIFEKQKKNNNAFSNKISHLLHNKKFKENDRIDIKINNYNKDNSNDKFKRNEIKRRKTNYRKASFKKERMNRKKTTNRKVSSEKMNSSLETKKNCNPQKKSKTSINHFINSFNNMKSIDNIPKDKELYMEKEKKLDDFQLNKLSYYEAIKWDKRNFLQVYWSILKREHSLIFLFYLNDYNIPYIKFARCFFFICTDMALNVFFFSDKSMHKIYLDYGKYNFIQQIPQIIYSTTVSQLLQVFICFLSLTDKHIYQIIELDCTKKYKAFQILKIIRLKLLIFFAFTIMMFGFYWYLISAFCSVYINTQKVFINDSIYSFIVSQIYPIILYLIPASLRKLALKDKKKRLKFIYKLSDIIPIF